MGVPAFFRWLTRKYPSVVVPCVEQKSVDINGVRIPVNSVEPNPNGVEFDNLYLDMNGIIHPCTHPEDRPAPRNEDEMMMAIFECIDRIFNIVRPRKILYMAIDGVAPRAKMNQQRSRRFRASKESVEKVSEIQRIRTELLLKGIQLPADKPKEEHFDSNCITPGTPFMSRLAECLHYYIHERLNNDPGWKGIKVILSDANVPGEGEHKIMDFIRKQRAQPEHDPNTQHCLCGADADLIMLGLATHEPNFTIIREEFKPNKPKPCDICGQIGHDMKDCLGGAGLHPDDMQKFNAEIDYIFVRLCVLREYLEKELQMLNLPFKYEFERVLDDWVFMCFFVGNDFLPHLPSLEIRENAIDRLIGLYKECVYKTGGYLTNSGDVNLERVQMIMTELGKVEDEIFKTRQQKELQFKAREKAKRRRTDGFNEYRPNWTLVKDTQFAPTTLGHVKPVTNARHEAYTIRKAGMHSQVEKQLQTTSSKNALESLMIPVDKDDNSKRGVKRKFDDNTDNIVDDNGEDDQIHDEVRLWEDGFKDRYYESKFDVGPDNLDFRHTVALHYVRGLCWVLRYYYQGCASWKWYFPYHYAPFASDFVHISGLSTEFETDTEPFRPLEQLMGVFPAASGKHIPSPWFHLMTDPDSPIIDFYPEDFKIDLNGKKFAWQGVALLPFVDEKRLFKALEPLYVKLTDEEKRRNMQGDDRLYISNKHPNYNSIHQLYKQNVSHDIECAISIEGMQGIVLVSEECVDFGGYIQSPVIGLDTIIGNIVCTVRFRDPKYGKGFMFPACKLKGAVDPPRVLKPADLDQLANKNWRAQIGMTPSTTRATLGQSGHRMLDHHIPKHISQYNTTAYKQASTQQNTYNRRNDYEATYNMNRRSEDDGYQLNNHEYHSRGYQQNYSSDQYQSQYRRNYGQNRNYNQYNSERNTIHNQHQQERRPPGPYRDGYRSYHSNNYNSSYNNRR